MAIPFKFRAIIVCDDVRKELSGKDILIGVYTSNMTVPSFPVLITLSYWFDVEPEELGTHDLQMRITLAGQSPAADFRVELNVGSLDPFVVVIPTMQLSVESETEIVLEVRDLDEWIVLKRQRIVRGDPPPWLIAPNASSQRV